MPYWWDSKILYNHCVKHYGNKKLETELPYDPAIPLLGTYPKELKAGSQRGMHIQMSTKGGMDKQDVVYIYNIYMDE